MPRTRRKLDACQIVQGRAPFIVEDRVVLIGWLYLLPQLNIKLRPQILAMKPGTRVVSHQFHMGEWEPDETLKVEFRDAYLWIVPAQIAGRWRTTVALPAGERSYEFEIKHYSELIAPALEGAGRERLWWSLTVGLRAAYADDDPWREFLYGEYPKMPERVTTLRAAVKAEVVK